VQKKRPKEALYENPDDTLKDIKRLIMLEDFDGL